MNVNKEQSANITGLPLTCADDMDMSYGTQIVYMIEQLVRMHCHPDQLKLGRLYMCSGRLVHWLSYYNKSACVTYMITAFSSFEIHTRQA